MEVVNETRSARLAALGFDAERQRLAREYRGKRVALGAIRIVAYVAISVWLLTGFTFQVKAWASLFGAGVPQYALYAILLYFLYWVPVIPVGLVGGFILERKYGMSVQGLRSWLADVAKSLGIGLAFTVLSVVVLFLLLARFPQVWWVLAWAISLVVGFAVMWLGPVLLAPLFFKFEPLRNETLVSRLRALAERAGTKVVGVYRMVASAKTTRALGGLAGLGRTRRIVLSDTLLDRYTPEEVESVIAHELAHHAHRDIARLAVAGAAASLLGLFFVDRVLRAAAPKLGFDGIADVAALPLLALTVAAVSTVLAPALNALSRRREAAADAFAIRMTGKPEAFRTTMVKIHDQNLGVADPHPLLESLFHDHPSGRRRVEAALRWRP